MNPLKILLLLILIIFLISCEKENESPQLASLNVVNAAVNLSAVKVNYFDEPIVWANYTDLVNYGANKFYSMSTGTVRPTIVSATDTFNVVYTEALALAGGDIYSLYLVGQTPAVESILVKENIPATYKDSVMGVRFINLSPNSGPLNINISGTPTVNEASDLAYKQSTDFKTYPAKSTNNTFVFQVKNASTNALLATYTLTAVRFFNVTLVLKGLTGATGTNAFGVFRVNNY